MIDVRELPVHYINLDNDQGRRISTQSLLFSMGFKDVNRLSGIKHEDPKVGCARSHHKALVENKAPFIIMEDDLVPMHNNMFEYSVPPDADALYLGCSQWGRYLNFSGPFTQYKRYTEDIVRVYNMLAAHAVIILTESYRDHLSRIAYHAGYQHGYHMDVGYAETQKFYNVYALDKPIFAQSGYNYNVTSGPLSEMGTDIAVAKKQFDVVKYDLNKLTGVQDRNGVGSFYDPRWSE